MKIMDGRDLYLFSMTCRRFNTMISNSEELWDNSYAVSLPQIHKALLQPPVPSYWAFSEPVSRRFLYLCMNSKNRRSFNEMEAVLEVMRMTTNTSLLLTTCYVIRRLTYTPPGCKNKYKDKISRNRMYFGQIGMIGLLLDFLQDQFNSSSLMAAVLCALNNICCNTARNCRNIVRDGGVNSILQIMKKYPSDISILDYASAVLANISREVKGDWIEIIVTEGISLTKKLLEADTTTSTESIVSGLDLYALLANRLSNFRINFGGMVLPLLKDLLVKKKEHTSVVIACTRALVEFSKCLDNQQLVEKLDIIPLLLQKLEIEKDSSLVFLLISALNSLLWKKTVVGKDHFYRYVSIVVEKFKKGFGEKKNRIICSSHPWTSCTS
jgi:hypothetical protein